MIPLSSFSSLSMEEPPGLLDVPCDVLKLIINNLDPISKLRLSEVHPSIRPLFTSRAEPHTWDTIHIAFGDSPGIQLYELASPDGLTGRRGAAVESDGAQSHLCLEFDPLNLDAVVLLEEVPAILNWIGAHLRGCRSLVVGPSYSVKISQPSSWWREERATAVCSFCIALLAVLDRHSWPGRLHLALFSLGSTATPPSVSYLLQQLRNRTGPSSLHLDVWRLFLRQGSEWPPGVIKPLAGLPKLESLSLFVERADTEGQCFSALQHLSCLSRLAVMSEASTLPPTLKGLAGGLRELAWRSYEPTRSLAPVLGCLTSLEALSLSWVARASWVELSTLSALTKLEDLDLGLHNVPFNSETGQLELPGMPGLRLPRLRVATLSIMPAIRVQEGQQIRVRINVLTCLEACGALRALRLSVASNTPSPFKLSLEETLQLLPDLVSLRLSFPRRSARTCVFDLGDALYKLPALQSVVIEGGYRITRLPRALGGAAVELRALGGQDLDRPDLVMGVKGQGGAGEGEGEGGAFRRWESLFEWGRVG